MQRTTGILALGALALASCRDTGTNPCGTAYPAVARTIDVAWPATARDAQATPIARLQVDQRHVVGIDGGCPTGVAVHLTFIAATATPTTFRYRVTWSGGGGGWLREGSIARLVVDGDVALDAVGDAPPYGSGQLAIDVSDARAMP